jgi:hypothetical protein
MANQLDKIEKVAQMAFIESLAKDTQAYERCCKVIEEASATLELSALNAGGIAQSISSSATSVNSTDMTSGKSVTTMGNYAIKHTVPWFKASQSLDLIESASQQVANSVKSSLNAMYFDGLEGLFTVAHPQAGAGQGQVGAGKKFIDSGLAYLQTEAGAGSQTNLVTAALSESALESARVLLREQRNQRGIKMNLAGPGSDMVLIVAPGNERSAHELVYSEHSGADLASNYNKSYAATVVYPFTTDADDWWLIDKEISPVGIVIGQKPVIETRISDDGFFLYFTAQYQAAFYKKPYHHGIVGSNVP